VLHAVPDLDAALRGARDLLAPSGRLLLTEVIRTLGFHMVTFGLLDGWWAHADDQRRLAGSPLLDDVMWRRRLEYVGFHNVEVLAGPADPVELSQRVICAAPSSRVSSSPIGS